MLESAYLLTIALAMYSGKLALIDRTAEALSALVSLVLFGTLTFWSFGVVSVDAGQETTVPVDPWIWLSLGGAGCMLAVFLLAVTGRLPESEEGDSNGGDTA